VSRIVVGVDGSDNAVDALDWAAREAQYRHEELRVVSAWIYPSTMGYAIAVDLEQFEKAAQDVADTAVARVRTTAPDVVVTADVCEGQPPLVLVAASAGADLLVVGTRGLGGFRGLVLGSVSQHCVHHAHCPVVVVRPSEAPAATGSDEP
jgi:nucleotide-binding universal stress UspA family protein